MAYDKFNIINSSAIPLNIDNVDTDQIIPARYLKATERKGFGDNLFRDWRYDSNNEMIKDFPLNNKKFSGKILVDDVTLENNMIIESWQKLISYVPQNVVLFDKSLLENITLCFDKKLDSSERKNTLNYSSL